MKIKRMIAELQRIAEENPDAEVKLNCYDGENALFVMSFTEGNEVWIEGKSDIDMSCELEARFEYALEHDIDELDFFMDLIETGITLEDIGCYLPDRYEYSLAFMKEHGLI